MSHSLGLFLPRAQGLALVRVLRAESLSRYPVTVFSLFPVQLRSATLVVFLAVSVSFELAAFTVGEQADQMTLHGSLGSVPNCKGNSFPRKPKRA